MRKLVPISITMLCLGCNPESKLTLEQIQGVYEHPSCPSISIQGSRILIDKDYIEFKIERIKGREFLSSSRRIIADMDNVCRIHLKDEPIYQPIRESSGTMYLDIGVGDYSSTVSFEKR